MAAKLLKNEMFMFGFRPTSDDWLSNLSDNSLPKCEKMAAKLSKNEIFVFGLCSTSDYGPSNPSDESHLNVKKWLPNH